MAGYVVTVPLVQVATDPTGVAVQVAMGGMVPDNITKVALDNLIDLGFVEKVKAKDEAQPADPEPFDPTKGGGIKETEAYVGNDKTKAAAMLELEQAKGDKARSSLVDKLEAIVTDPGA